MKNNACLVIMCFVAGVVGAMIGADITATAPGDGHALTRAVSVVQTANSNPSHLAGATSISNPALKAIERVGPAVVNIDTVFMRRTSVFGFSDPFADVFGADPFSRLVPSKGQGSGFIIDAKNGYVVTNEHVVHEVTNGKGKIKVSLPDKRTFEATVVGADPQYDVAVLKIKADDLPSAGFATSDELTIGQWAIAIGNPFGFRNTVTLGVVSSVGRILETSDGSKLEGLIQTDAAINPGNSGGPLCDIQGNVVGINTAIISGAEGIGFAIEASSVKPAVDEIIQFGRVRHGWTGMTFWDISHRLANRLGLDSTDGALVAEVYTQSAAGKADIKPGYVIVEANGQSITSAEDIQDVLRTARAGDELSLVLIQDGECVPVTIKLDDVPKNLR